MHYAPINGDALNLDLPIFWLRNGVNFTVQLLENTKANSVATAIVAVALGLVRAVKSYNFVATLYLLSSLSLVFQRVSVDLHSGAILIDSD